VRSAFLLILVMALAAPALAYRSVEGHVTWSGKMHLEESVLVAKGAVLELAPGTELQFAPKATLLVEGKLQVLGTAERPVRLLASVADPLATWPGVTLQNAAEEAVFRHALIEQALVPVTANGSRLNLGSSTIRGGSKGVVLVDSMARLEQVTLQNITEVAIDASVRSRVEVIGCTLTGSSKVGIQAAKQAVAVVRDNHVSGAEIGIFFNGDFPPLENNVLDHCGVGIALLQANAASVARGNRVSDSRIGIGCNQFSSPLLERNTLERCEKGIDCFQGSSPVIRGNLLVKNDIGISCVQMSNPVVTRNELRENRVGAYLHLSAYASFHDNNFLANQVHIDLDNMSYDWEQRASHKPKRNRQTQNERLVQLGRAAPQEVRVEVDSQGFVDAVGNYWGPETTREMTARGAEADISTINDGFDVPVLTYDGWQGEYKKDRVRYAGWLEQPVDIAAP